MTAISSLLHSVVSLARQAGAAILEVYSQQIEVTNKADDSPLTQADLRSHEIIVRGLKALTPDIPVLSEEGSSIPFAERQRWQRYWLVDPLDGTKEFVSRNGEFTVNIALVEDHAPVLGVVYVPVTDTLYSGIVGERACRQTGREPPVDIRVCDPPAELRVVGSRSHGADSLTRYLQQLGPHRLLKVGSSLKFCLVAEGNADLYPRFGPTSEWDTAAAQAVVEAAGGAVVTRDGEPLRYNTKESLLNPEFMVFADAKLQRQW